MSAAAGVGRGATQRAGPDGWWPRGLGQGGRLGWRGGGDAGRAGWFVGRAVQVKVGHARPGLDLGLSWFKGLGPR